MVGFLIHVLSDGKVIAEIQQHCFLTHSVVVLLVMMADTLTQVELFTVRQWAVQEELLLCVLFSVPVLLMISYCC